MTERIQVHPNEARRLAAARVKARIRKEQNLPGFHSRRNRKKFQPRSSCTVKHNKPWDERFSTSNGNTDSSLVVKKPKAVKHVKQTNEKDLETLGDKLSKNVFISVTDRQDGSPILTTTIHRRDEPHTTQTQSRSISPFDLERVKEALGYNLQESCGLKPGTSNDKELIINSQEQNTSISLEMTSHRISDNEALRYWNHVKTNFKTKLHPFYPQDENSSTHPISVESMTEYILCHVIEEVSYEMNEVLEQHSEEIFKRL